MLDGMKYDPFDLGFSPMYGQKQRAQALVRAVDKETATELAGLEKYRRTYWEDWRKTLRASVASMLTGSEEGELEDDLVLLMTEMAIRLADKFSLPMAEILVTGEHHGVPELESNLVS